MRLTVRTSERLREKLKKVRVILMAELEQVQ